MAVWVLLLGVCLGVALSAKSPDYISPKVITPIKMSKVLHLNQGMRHWRQGYDDADLTKNTYLDFETKSDCVRINTTYPMELPTQFTWCGQYKSKTWVHPWGGRIALFQMGTTTHGKSVINDFLNPKLHHKNITGWDSNNANNDFNATYRVIAGMVIWGNNGNQENYVMIGNNYWYIGGSTLARWNQWDSMCVGINLAVPSVVIYHNGEMYEEKVFEDEGKLFNLEGSVNASYFDVPTVTDIFLGCALFQAMGQETFGYITNVHMFNRILSHDEMVSMTDCSWSALPDGQIFTWDSFDYTFYQTYNPVVNIPNDLICPRSSGKGLIYVPGHHFTFTKALAACKKIGGELLSINSQEDFQETGVLLRSVVEDYANKYGNMPDPDEWNTKWAYEGGGIDSFITLVRNRSNNDNTDRFYDYFTGQENQYLRWWANWNLHENHDVGWIIYIRGYLQSHNLNIEEDWWKGWISGIPDGEKFRDETILLASDDRIPQNPGWAQKPITCRTENSSIDHLKVVLKGMCPGTYFDTKYVLNWVPMNNNPWHYVKWWYQGIANSSIIYVGDNKWEMTDKQFWYWNHEEEETLKRGKGVFTSDPEYMGLGRHKVTWEYESCVEMGKMEAESEILITTCKDDEFTCNSGDCLEMKMRCNTIVDCPFDEGDETNCAKVLLTETYNSDAAPNTGVKINGDYTVNKAIVNVSLHIRDILEVSEVQSLLEVSFSLILSWFDPRITFTNLNQDSNFNKLTDAEKQKIWKPIIEFSNTKYVDTTVTDKEVVATVLKLGNKTDSDGSLVYNTYKFLGKENLVRFNRIYGIKFICIYDVSWYPFDIQNCLMDLKSPGTQGTYVNLVRDELKYLGKKEMSSYFLRDIEYTQEMVEEGNMFNLGSYVQCKITLGRRLLSVMTTVYLPTILLNIIGHITHYFKPFFFESALAVNLTVMLVLTSMFISVVEGLPKTSYMKMVEVWLIFNLLLPFSDVLLHTYTDHVRSAIDEAREVNHHGMVVKVGQDQEEEKEEWEYDKDLVSKDERKQDAALKAHYEELKKNTHYKARLHMCHTIGHKVMPSIAIWFAISYWVTGYAHIMVIDQTINIILQVIFTILWFGTIFLLNMFWNKISCTTRKAK